MGHPAHSRDSSRKGRRNGEEVGFCHQVKEGRVKIAAGRLIPVFQFEQLFAISYRTLFVTRMGLPTPDLRKLDFYGLPGYGPFDLLVLGREALAERRM